MSTRSLASIAIICVAIGAGCSSATPFATTSPNRSQTPNLIATIVRASPTPGSTRTPVSPTIPPTAVPSRSGDPRVVGPGEPWFVYQGGTSGPARIRLVRPDGTGDHALAPNLGGGEQLHPDWSHDGQRVAFVVDAIDGTRDIWVASVDGSNLEMVYDCAAPCGWADDPAWSPDDRELLFHQGSLVGEGPDGVSTLELVDLATGARETVLTAEPAEYFYVPRWAPDGRRLVVELVRFASTRLDEDESVAGTIGIIDSADVTSAFAPLLPMDSRASYPDWDPNNDQVLFVLPTTPTDADGRADLYVMSNDGGDPVALTSYGQSGGRAIQPSWAPNGDLIVFVAEDMPGTNPTLATTNPDGTGEQQLVDGTSRTHPRLRPTTAD